jgi:iron complex transport system ATP-binding protein
MSAQPTQAKASAAEPMTLAFDVTVTAVQELSPNFRRITFGGYSLRDFGVARRHPGPQRQAHDPVASPPTARHCPCRPSKWKKPAGTANGWPWTRRSAVTCAPTPSGRRLDAVYPEIDVDFVMHFDDAGTRRTRRQLGPQCQTGRRPHHHRPQQPGSALHHCRNLLRHRMAARAWPSASSWPATKRHPRHQRHPRKPASRHDRPRLPGSTRSRRLPRHLHPADVEITWLARGAAIGRSRPHGELLKEAVAKAVPVPGWVGIKAAEPVPAPSPKTSTWTWTSSGKPRTRMETAAIEATKNPTCPAGAMPFYAWIAGEAFVIKDMRRYLGAGRRDRPEAGCVHGVLAPRQGRGLSLLSLRARGGGRRILCVLARSSLRRTLPDAPPAA